MSNIYEVDPSDPQELLDRIEQDPESFTMGRRNNDMVNWFLAMLLLHPKKASYFHIEKFKDLTKDLSPAQQQSLTLWEEDPEKKLSMLYSCYGGLIDPRAIMGLWIQIGYAHLSVKEE